MNRVPFGAPSAPAEWVYTTAGRIPCESCGEWVYTRRPISGGPSAFPPDCLVCGAPVPAGAGGRGRSMTGIARISAERKRQRSRNGEAYSRDWDEQHRRGELALAAAVYAVPPDVRDASVRRLLWPGSHFPYRPNPQDRIRELEKAGALIASEIDRLLAAGAGEEANNE